MKDNNTLHEQMQGRAAELEEVIERISDGLIAISEHGDLTYLNQRAADILGCPKQNLLGQHIWTLLPHLVGQPLFQACQRAMAELREQYLEDYSARSSRWHEYSIYPSSSGLSILICDITEKKKAGEQIKERAVQLQTLSDNLKDLMIYQVIRDPAGTIRFTFASNCVELITGKKPAEIIGKPDIFSQVILQEDQRRFLEAEKVSFRDMTPLDIEVRIKGYTGIIRWIRIYSTPRQLPDGSVLRDGFCTDVTERKMAEEALRATELQYHSLIDQASDAIVIHDRAGNFIDVNSSTCSWSGYSREELLQLNVKDLIDPEQLQTDPLRLDMIANGQSAIRERRMKHKNGSILDVEANVKTLPDGRMLAILRDITERKRAADQIHKEKVLSESIINSLPGIFYLRAFPGKLLKWNKQLEVITGYSEKELSDLEELHLFNEKDRPFLRQKVQDIFTHGKAELEVALVTKEGKAIPFHLTGAPISYEGKLCILGTGFDISEGKRTQAKLQQINEQLRHLSAHLQDVREEERTSIAREIHDELGQQLTGLKMDIAWLRKKMKTEDKQFLNKLSSMNELIDQTVGSVRRIATQLRPSVLDDLGLVDALEWQSVEFGNRFGIQVEFVSGIPELEFPSNISTGLFRIYQESLTNVARHSGAKKVMTTLQLNEEDLMLTVTDDGHGFDIHSAGDRKTFGLLGIKERTLMLGGKCEIVSEPEKGTAITVTMPARPIIR
jgi:PAS domain S-box-containing protein